MTTRKFLSEKEMQLQTVKYHGMATGSSAEL